MAISFGLIPTPMANRIMDRMFAEMKEVGYNRFDFGLPGNLIPVRKEDHAPVGVEWGAPQKAGSAEFRFSETLRLFGGSQPKNRRVCTAQTLRLYLGQRG